MFKLVKNTYSCAVALTSLTSMLTKEAVLFSTEYINESKSVNKVIKEEINLPLIEKLLSRIEDINDLDIPKSAKDLAIAKVQSMLDAELTK